MVAMKEELPQWVNPLLQGMAYWIGYKKQLYRHYPLNEGAIVSEATHLIHSNLDTRELLKCEVMYRTLSSKITGMRNSRADLIIFEKNKAGKENAKYVIEVKREQAPNSQKVEDFKKLSKTKKCLPDVRCFLLLVSQNRRPRNYVTAKGLGNRANIKGDTYSLNVKRVCKASDTFKKIDNANYACLIEVELLEK